MKDTKITFVKKIKADGEPCRKCLEVEQRLQKDGLMEQIHNVVIADERDRNSAGMQLAKKYKVERAPFFVVENSNAETRIYTIYLQFAKEIFHAETDESNEAKEILEANPDLDLI